MLGLSAGGADEDPLARLDPLDSFGTAAPVSMYLSAQYMGVAMGASRFVQTLLESIIGDSRWHR
ncbi:MAG: hypothetical protein Q7U75_17520, partial [Desulfobacterales bacterium]|nr:hypothetical protein [Desulfobacterales bacterium]